MIVDCHTHLNRYEDENIPALPDKLELLQREMRMNRVSFAFVLSSYKDVAGRPSIAEMVKATRDVPNIFVVAGMSFLNQKSWDLGAIKEYLKEGKVKGFKFYCGYEPFMPSEPAMLPVVELAKEFDVPVYVHTGDTYAPTGKLKYSHPLNIDEFAVDHPTLKIIICHLGNPWIRDTMEIVYKNKNVYTDISGLVLGNFSDRFEKYMEKQINEMIVYGVEPERVLYGTDWPISSMTSYLEFVNTLGLTQDARAKILGLNALKLFRLDPKLAPYH